MFFVLHRKLGAMKQLWVCS